MLSNLLNLLLVFSYCSACVFGSNGNNNQKRSKRTEWFQERLSHKGVGISDVGLQKVADLGNEKHFNETFTRIQIPRVVDTPGHTTVREFIVNEMENLGWTVERHSFNEKTPIGEKTFTNVIATLNPAATRRLVLACHYDSKLTPENFLGATDSAVPCSMLINLAYTMLKELNVHKHSNFDLTLQLYFIDGEEAFEKWSDTDSLYGSRKLASKLYNTPFPTSGRFNTNELHRIDLFVLLDLIGTEDIQFFSLFKETDNWYLRLSSFEKRLLDLNLLPRKKPMFREQAYYHASIEDDHIPFLKKGVPILHLISVPFPDVWHKITDNQNALHPPSIENMNTIIRAFVADYLHLLL